MKKSVPCNISRTLLEHHKPVRDIFKTVYGMGYQWTGGEAK